MLEFLSETYRDAFCNKDAGYFARCALRPVSSISTTKACSIRWAASRSAQRAARFDVMQGLAVLSRRKPIEIKKKRRPPTNPY